MEAFRNVLTNTETHLRNGPWDHYHILYVANGINPPLAVYLMNENPKTKQKTLAKARVKGTRTEDQRRVGQYLPICGERQDATLQRLHTLWRNTDNDLLGFVIHTGPSNHWGHFVALVREVPENEPGRFMLIDSLKAVQPCEKSPKQVAALLHKAQEENQRVVVIFKTHSDSLERIAKQWVRDTGLAINPNGGPTAPGGTHAALGGDLGKQDGANN